MTERSHEVVSKSQQFPALVIPVEKSAVNPRPQPTAVTNAMTGNGKDKAKVKLGKTMNGIHVPSILEWMPQANVCEGVIEKHFEIGGSIGRGVSSEVFLGWDNKRKRNVAIKMMPKDRCSATAFANEVTFLSSFRHVEGVIELYNAAMDEDNYYLVTQWAEGGDLLSRITLSAAGRLPEASAKYIAHKLLLTLAALRRAGVLHRDLKPENVVFLKGGEPQLVDFADAVLLQTLDQEFDELCGTVPYLAPERFRIHSGWELLQSDMWTLGVFVFEMVFGKRAFYGVDTYEMISKICRGKYRMPHSLPASDECRDFIRRMLQLDAKKRMSPSKALRHPWITGELPPILESK